MNSTLQIKGRVFGEGRPLICVAVMETKRKEIIEEITRLSSDGVDIVEWRIDAFEEVQDLSAVREVLQVLQEQVKNTVVLFTFRSKEQGGICTLDDEMVKKLRLTAAKSGVVDLIDVECVVSEEAEHEVVALQEMGISVVASFHEFDKTPTEKEMMDRLEQMRNTKADIVKLAVMPEVSKDVVRLLKVTDSFHEKYPNQPLITMSMGQCGALSRVSGGIFGSCVTFGAGRKSSAPGQIPYEKLKMMLDYLGE